jgi:hypothetical protein
VPLTKRRIAYVKRCCCKHLGKPRAEHSVSCGASVRVLGMLGMLPLTRPCNCLDTVRPANLLQKPRFQGYISQLPRFQLFNTELVASTR